jgi:hypothetical protein
MKKPSRASVKNAAIATALIGGTIVTTKLSINAVNTYYQAKIDVAMLQHLVSVIDRTHPEVVTEAVQIAGKELETALAAYV